MPASFRNVLRSMKVSLLQRKQPVEVTTGRTTLRLEAVAKANHHVVAAVFSINQTEGRVLGGVITVP